MRRGPVPAEPDLPSDLDDWPSAGGIADEDELSAVEVRGARWAGIDVASVRVEETRIAGGDLSGAKLVGPDFRDVVVEDANLGNLTVVGGTLARMAVVRARMTGIGLAEVELRDATFRDCGGDMAAFRRSSMLRVTFDGCTLRQADFTGAACEHVRFHDCDLTGASFWQARFAQSEFRRCRMEEIEGVEGLRGASMDAEQVLALAPALAAALGIGILLD
jgi:uncharacterized protein YjbI with pentapeptide repeats